MSGFWVLSEYYYPSVIIRLSFGYLSVILCLSFAYPLLIFCLSFGIDTALTLCFRLCVDALIRLRVVEEVESLGFRVDFLVES